MPNSLTEPSTGIGTLVIDTETNGLLRHATRIHCVSLYWVEEDRTESFNDEPYGKGEPFCIKEDAPMRSSYSISNALCSLMAAENIISHNGIAYDVPQAQKHYPFFRTLEAKHWDTLILSRIYHPNLLDIDLTRKWPHMPASLYGSHSLEAYGYRLRCFKDNFSKTTDWKEWSPEMQEYCKKDVAILAKLWKHFQKYLNP